MEPYETKLILAKNVRAGNLLDLERDEFADPDGTDPLYPFTFRRVAGVEREGLNFIRIDFYGASVVFPLDHELQGFETPRGIDR